MDILCLNETKIDATTLDKSNETSFIPKDYHHYWNCCKSRGGYAGTAIISRIKPLSVVHDIGISKHDQEGRTLTVEYEKFFLVACYVPNAGQKLDRLSYRTKEWDVDFRAYLNKLKAKKPTILTGDLNVAYQDIDVYDVKKCKKLAGCTPEEKAEFGKLLADGWTDSFRDLHPEAKEFSYFSARSDSKATNSGMRLDYFVVSNNGMKAVTGSNIEGKVQGSDHQPIELLLDLSKF